MFIYEMKNAHEWLYETKNKYKQVEWKRNHRIKG